MFLLNADGEVEQTWFLDLGPRAVPVETRGDLGQLFASGEIVEYDWFDNFVAPWGGYIFGRMIDRGEIKLFVYDTEAGVNYVQMGRFGDFGAPTAISDGRLVTFFQSDGEIFSPDLPEDMRAGVIDGDPLLCLYELK